MMDPTGLPPSGPVLRRGFVDTKETKNGVKIIRDTRAKDRYEHQVKLYSLCSCGSGDKYKFCCKDKPKFVLNTDNL